MGRAPSEHPDLHIWLPIATDLTNRLSINKSEHWQGLQRKMRGIRHRDNTKYEGEFFDDLQNGSGVESWPDRSQIVGQFTRGLLAVHLLRALCESRVSSVTVAHLEQVDE